MILTLDVGNSQIYGGVFDNNKMRISFRRSSKTGSSSDQMGIFLRNVLRENDIDPKKVKKIAICSVVPDVIYSLKGACKKYFNVEPFVLQAGVKTGLKIKYLSPVEVGADRIANSIAGLQMFPKKNLVIVDLGTATTFCAISKEKDYLGGAISAGLKLCMESLENRTAKLPTVEIVEMNKALGRATVESIQSGLYYGHVGMIRELCGRLASECFATEKPFIIGTGGFAYLFEKEKVFDAIIPDLVLKGLVAAIKMNEVKDMKESHL